MIDLSRVPDALFATALESNLRLVTAERKAQAHFLAAIRARLDADAAWLEPGESAGESKETLFDGDRALYEPEIVRAFAARKRPEVPRNMLLSPLRVRSRFQGVLGAARAGRDFERGSGRILNRFSRLLGDDLARREEERVSRVLDRIRSKVLVELRPRDLAYQILHGLFKLVHHDHSAALLTYDPEAGVFRVEAEKIIWTKTESAFIGHEIALAPELREELARSREVRVFAGEGAADAQGTDRLLRELLDYNRGQGLPPATSILFAPLFHGGDLLGLLKLATGKRPAFDGQDIEVVKRFLPAAALALRNVRVKVSLENQAMQAEARAGLVTLARAVAHDVNNAVGGILPLAEQIREELRDGTLDTDGLDQDLSVIIDSASLCKRIFSNMLRVGTESSGSGPVDVNQVIGRMQPMLEALVAARAVALRFELGDALPVIRFSKQHLERILWNLVTNACEALAAAGGRIDISTRAAEGGGLLLAVADDGPGIPQETLKKIHEPFFTTKPSGTGLGLSICRSMAWQYGGRMEIRSARGEGTTVEIHLPPPRAEAGAAS